MIQITNDFLMDTRKVWQAGDSKVITMSHHILKLLGAQKGDYVKFFVKKVYPSEVKQEEKQNEPEIQESRDEVQEMPV